MSSLIDSFFLGALSRDGPHIVLLDLLFPLLQHVKNLVDGRLILLHGVGAHSFSSQVLDFSARYQSAKLNSAHATAQAEASEEEVLTSLSRVSSFLFVSSRA